MTTRAPPVPITIEQFKAARHQRRQVRPAELGWSTWLAISTVCSSRHISLSIKRKCRLTDCTLLVWQTRFWRLRPYFPVSWRVWRIMCSIDVFNQNWSTCPRFHFLQNYNIVKTWARQNLISTKYGKQISWAMWRAANSTTALVVVAPIRVDSECYGSEGSVAVWLG